MRRNPHGAKNATSFCGCKNEITEALVRARIVLSNPIRVHERKREHLCLRCIARIEALGALLENIYGKDDPE